MCAVHLVACGPIASTTVELAETEGIARPIDFSVDATHIYFAYEGFQSLDALLSRQRNGQTNAMLGIYSRSDGAEVASLDLSLLWDARPDFGPVMSGRTVPFRDGVAVAVGSGDHLHLAFVDRDGAVGQRGGVQNFGIGELDRYGDFVLATGSRRLALLDENLHLKHEWRTPGILVLAHVTGDDIVVLDREPDSERWWFSGALRWLTLADGGLTERMAVDIPDGFSLIPMPRLIVWPDRALVVGVDVDGWKECSVSLQDRRATCGPAIWAEDLAAWSDALDWAQLDVVGAGDSYAVIVPNGCAMWTRRYDPLRSITPRQFVLPSGRTDLGRMHDFVVKELEGDLFLLHSGLTNVSWWEAGDYRIALRKLALSESAPLRPRPRIEGCSAWRDASFGSARQEDGGIRLLNADDVKECVARGANPNAVFNCGEWTRPLSQTAVFADAAVVRALIAAGAEVNVRDEAGETALHKAARYARSDATLRALLDGGADPTLRDNAGRTAWDYAKENDSLSASEVLPRLADE